MTDYTRLFNEAWDEAAADSLKRSPSYKLEDYTVTGRASAAYGGKRTAKWWADNGPIMVESWHKWRQDNPGWRIFDIAGKPSVEVELNFTLPGDIPVKGFIDRAFVLPSGELGLLDIKTGRLPETGEQLGLYRVGLGILYDLWPDWGYFWTPEKGHTSPIDLRMYTPDYFAGLYRAAIGGINAGAFIPKPANGCSRWCGVASYCAATGGVNAAGVDPLLSNAS